MWPRPPVAVVTCNGGDAATVTTRRIAKQQSSESIRPGHWHGARWLAEILRLRNHSFGIALGPVCHWLPVASRRDLKIHGPTRASKTICRASTPSQPFSSSNALHLIAKISVLCRAGLRAIRVDRARKVITVVTGSLRSARARQNKGQAAPHEPAGSVLTGNRWCRLERRTDTNHFFFSENSHFFSEP
jgi:hypothetical protein